MSVYEKSLIWKWKKRKSSMLGFGRCSIAVFIIIRVPVDRTIFGASMSLLLAGLFGGFGDLASASFLLGDGLDDTDGDRLPHVTDGEATERRVVGESLD